MPEPLRNLTTGRFEGSAGTGKKHFPKQAPPHHKLEFLKKLIHPRLSAQEKVDIEKAQAEHNRATQRYRAAQLAITRIITESEEQDTVTLPPWGSSIYYDIYTLLKNRNYNVLGISVTPKNGSNILNPTLADYEAARIKLEHYANLRFAGDESGTQDKFDWEIESIYFARDNRTITVIQGEFLNGLTWTRHR